MSVNSTKSLTPVIAAAALAALVALATSFFTIRFVAPIADPRVTIGYFWTTVWDHGIAMSCGEGPGLFRILDFGCRTVMIGKWLAYPPFYVRLWLCVGCAMMGAVLAAIMAYSHAPVVERVRTIRGTWPRYDSQARASLRKTIAVSGTPNVDSLWFVPYVQLTPVAEAHNILIVGDHGSGKSAVIRGWAEQVFARGERAIVHDAKGDILASAPLAEILLVAPHDARGWGWDIGRDVTNAQGAREVAAKLVPQGASAESMWTDGARAILSGAIEALQHERDTEWGWADLFAFIFSSPRELRDALDKARSPAGNLLEFDSDGVATKTTLSLMLTLWVAALTTIRPLAQAAASDPNRRFSIRDWLSDSSTMPRVIVLQHNAEYPLLSTAVGGLLVDIVCGKLLSPAAPRRSKPWLHLILDELPVLGRLHQFPRLLNVGREKGAAAIVATQDWEQLLKLYGPHDASTLEARFRIKVVCSLGISETRERVVTKYAGRRTIETWEANGKDRRIRRETEIDVIAANYLTDELGVREVGKRLFVRVVIFGLGNPAIAEIPFTQWRERRKAYVVADWAAAAD